MTQKLSRRDAIKLLGAAAGATLLANLPSKWRTPELASGVLPAHAQTSSLLLTITDGGFTSFDVKDSPEEHQLIKSTSKLYITNPNYRRNFDIAIFKTCPR